MEKVTLKELGMTAGEEGCLTALLARGECEKRMIFYTYRIDTIR